MTVLLADAVVGLGVEGVGVGVAWLDLPVSADGECLGVEQRVGRTCPPVEIDGGVDLRLGSNGGGGPERDEEIPEVVLMDAFEGIVENLFRQSGYWTTTLIDLLEC